jgi:flavin reductase (DIM6/NTAB) family NADH-FMN oxidoreductase RutF
MDVVDALASVDRLEIHDVADHMVFVGNAVAARWSECGKRTIWTAERRDLARLGDAD